MAYSASVEGDKKEHGMGFITSRGDLEPTPPSNILITGETRLERDMSELLSDISDRIGRFVDAIVFIDIVYSFDEVLTKYSSETQPSQDQSSSLVP